MEKLKICFDMDGTIANLYKVANWLSKLRAEDSSPYLEAEPMCNMEELTRICEMLQYLGHKITIISWCSKNGTAEYNTAVRRAKREWLRKNFPIKFDEVHIVKYGTPKYRFMDEDSVLIDDEFNNRFQCELHGAMSVDPTTYDILQFLRGLLPDEI